MPMAVGSCFDRIGRPKSATTGCPPPPRYASDRNRSSTTGWPGATNRAANLGSVPSDQPLSYASVQSPPGIPVVPPVPHQDHRHTIPLGKLVRGFRKMLRRPAFRLPPRRHSSPPRGRLVDPGSRDQGVDGLPVLRPVDEIKPPVSPGALRPKPPPQADTDQRHAWAWPALPRVRCTAADSPHAALANPIRPRATRQPGHGAASEQALQVDDKIEAGRTEFRHHSTSPPSLDRPRRPDPRRMTCTTDAHCRLTSQVTSA